MKKIKENNFFFIYLSVLEKKIMNIFLVFPVAGNNTEKKTKNKIGAN